VNITHVPNVNAEGQQVGLKSHVLGRHKCLQKRRKANVPRFCIMPTFGSTGRPSSTSSSIALLQRLQASKEASYLPTADVLGQAGERPH
jgi:hypothetical protein